MTLENEDLSQRYQGVVPLSGERLADCLREYFEASEQLPTRLWLHATENGASGLLLQRLSDDSVQARTGVERRSGAAGARRDRRCVAARAIARPTRCAPKSCRH